MKQKNMIPLKDLNLTNRFLFDVVAEQSGSDLIRRIHNRVCKVRKNEEIGVRYMQAWEEKVYERREGREEGRQDYLRELIQKKLEKGKSIEEIAGMVEEDVEAIRKLAEELAAQETA